MSVRFSEVWYFSSFYTSNFLTDFLDFESNLSFLRLEGIGGFYAGCYVGYLTGFKALSLTTGRSYLLNSGTTFNDSKFPTLSTEGSGISINDPSVLIRSQFNSSWELCLSDEVGLPIMLLLYFWLWHDSFSIYSLLSSCIIFSYLVYRWECMFIDSS